MTFGPQMYASRMLLATLRIHPCAILRGRCFWTAPGMWEARNLKTFWYSWSTARSLKPPQSLRPLSRRPGGPVKPQSPHFLPNTQRSPVRSEFNLTTYRSKCLQDTRGRTAQQLNGDADITPYSGFRTMSSQGHLIWEEIKSFLWYLPGKPVTWTGKP